RTVLREQSFGTAAISGISSPRTRLGAGPARRIRSALAAAPLQEALEARDVGRFLLEFPDIAEELIQHRAPVHLGFRFGALDPGRLQGLDRLALDLLSLFRAEHVDRQAVLLLA